jgi:hypothetical protein
MGYMTGDYLLTRQAIDIAGDQSKNSVNTGVSVSGCSIYLGFFSQR